MSSGNYESQILETIQMLVDNAISKAKYDKTIQGIVSRCVDPTIGKYIIKYQDSSFYAYSQNTDATYAAGTSVYVLVPGNDMKNDKVIVGTVEKLGVDYVSIIEGENGYEVVGVNCANTQTTFELCSYKSEDIKVLYDRDNDIDLINLDVFGLESYIKQSNNLICGATFKTSLPTEQKFRGDYGIVFTLDFLDNGTGETVTKTYMVNVDQMTGNPYSYTTSSRQYGIFEVDGANFQSLNQVYIFEYDFPNTEENKENDIFISNIEISAAKALDAEEAATCALTFVTPQGTYFNDKDLDTATRRIQAEIRIKGQTIDNNSQSVKYYWFVENNKINTKSEKYNQYGGAGWECLNSYNIIQPADENNEALVEWVSGTYTYTTAKKDNIAKETSYKCVAVYDNNTTLSKTIVIYNYSSDYEISIDSDKGTTFYYDLGNPTLTCYINGEEKVGDEYSYVWSVINNSGQFSILSETEESNLKYNNAVAAYDDLIARIQAEQVLTGQVQEELNLYSSIKAQYEYIMRIEQNKLHHLKISTITNFSTYKCSVYYNGVFIGTSSIIITNSLKNQSGYSLVLNNGNQVFKYNENGISPASASLENPVAVLPLEFTLYDNQGNKVNTNAIGKKNIHWTIPTQNTLLSISNAYGNPSEETNTTSTYTGYETLDFDINNRYDATKDNNEILLTIDYKDNTLTAKTNFTITKEGEIGTNGTDFICKIIPNIAEGVAPLYPTLTYNEFTKQYSLNYTPKSENKWLKVQLWHDGELIYEGVESGDTTENEYAKVEWSILKNNYGKQIYDSSNLSITSETGEIYFNEEEFENPANIIKCKITYNDVDYYAAMPIITTRVKNADYTINLAEQTGFRSVMYTADGKAPQYDSAHPFELLVTQEINGIKENISLLELSNFKVDYDWNVLGQIYMSDWQSEVNLIAKDNSYLQSLKRNQKNYGVVDTYNGFCVNNALLCNITQNGEKIGSIHLPIYFYINRYGNSAMNGWDGNSISIDEESGVILSPQVGAGKKNEDNSFTGIFMGSIKEAGSKEIETGLFGYNAGQRTISLNAEDGSARFGSTGAGQIVIDPSSGEALLTSGNYDEEKGTGMIINLSEPSIKFGSGKFGVNSDGQLYATGFATTGYVDATKEEIEESVKIFDVITNTSSLSIPATVDNIPTVNATYIVTYYGVFKGNTVGGLEISQTSAAIPGIEVSLADAGAIKFLIKSNTAIENIINNFTFNFIYKNGTKTYSVDKQISLTLATQGKPGDPGGPGEQGKSAYEVWKEAGNDGTEEDYLNSLKGEPGDTGVGIKSVTKYYFANNIPSGQGYELHSWDGDTTDREVVENLIGEEMYDMYKFSDRIFAPEELLNQYFELSYNDGGKPEWIEIPAVSNLTDDGNVYVANYYFIPAILVIKEPVGDYSSYSTGTYLLSFVNDGMKGWVSNFMSADDSISIEIGNWTETSQEVSETNKYLWSYEKTIFTDGTETNTTPIVISTYVSDGKTSYLHIAYANSADGTKDFSITDSANKLYIGQYTDFVEDNSIEPSDYTWTLTKGNPGDPGRGIAATETFYQVGNSGTEQPTGEWLPTIPEVKPGQFLWVQTTTIYTDNTETESYSVSQMGEKGEPGTAAKVVTIDASSQFFKSTEGQYGEFTPETIVLTPVFQSLNFGNWQYYIPSENIWNEIVSGEHGLAIDDTTKTLTISRDCDLYTEENTSITFKCIASENIYTASVTIAKIYDVVDLDAVVSIEVQYAVTDTSNIEDANAAEWLPQIKEGSANKFIWQRTKKVYLNSEEAEYSVPVCLTLTNNFVTSVVSQYIYSISASEVIPPTDDTNIQKQYCEWGLEKPPFSSEYYICERTVTYWSNGTPDYGKITWNTDSFTLNDIINERVNAIQEDLENGSVIIDKNMIYIMNGEDIYSSTDILRMNQEGICFGTKLVGVTDLSKVKYTSVWSLNGTFDAQSIKVINLSANNIKNGILRLYDTPKDNTDGKMLIFKGDPPSKITNEFDNEAIVEVSSEGIKVKVSNGSIFKVGTENGLEIINPNGDKFCYASADGTVLVTTKTKIIDYVDYGDSLRGLIMEKTIDNKQHKGIGFIKI